MYVVTAAEMRKLDRCAIDSIGIPAIALMENAGRGVADEVQAYLKGKRGPVLIMAGKGNNGGDGLVAARHLADAGVEVLIVYADDPKKLTDEAAFQRDIVTRMQLPYCVYCSADNGGPSPVSWRNFACIVDALLGTGARNAPREPYAALIRAANESKVPILAVDIPSGLDADTGHLFDPHIRAERTISLAFPKRGLLQYPGAAAAGSVSVIPIGIPMFLAAQAGVKTHLLTEDLLDSKPGWRRLQDRQPDSHKGTFGHLLVVAANRRMSGAGLLCSTAALRIGSGLVTWAVPDSMLDSLIGARPEIMLEGVPDAGQGDWQGVSAADVVRLAAGKVAVAMGPGMGRFLGGEAFIRTIWENIDCPLVLDADALNLMAESFPQWPKRRGSVILTPHPGEMARLAKKPVSEIQADRIGNAVDFAVEHGVVLVLKGAGTVVALPDGSAYINQTGNPGMAKGGSGDVLTGIIAGLLAQGYRAEEAACMGVYLHGKAGDLAASRRGITSMLAADLLDELGKV